MMEIKPDWYNLKRVNMLSVFSVVWCDLLALGESVVNNDSQLLPHQRLDQYLQINEYSKVDQLERPSWMCLAAVDSFIKICSAVYELAFFS